MSPRWCASVASKHHYCQGSPRENVIGGAFQGKGFYRGRPCLKRGTSKQLYKFRERTKRHRFRQSQRFSLCPLEMVLQMPMRFWLCHVTSPHKRAKLEMLAWRHEEPPWNWLGEKPAFLLVLSFGKRGGRLFSCCSWVTSHKSIYE